MAPYSSTALDLAFNPLFKSATALFGRTIASYKLAQRSTIIATLYNNIETKQDAVAARINHCIESATYCSKLAERQYLEKRRKELGITYKALEHIAGFYSELVEKTKRLVEMKREGCDEDEEMDLHLEIYELEDVLGFDRPAAEMLDRMKVRRRNTRGSQQKKFTGVKKQGIKGIKV